jgi:predicted AlkP superfamily phosphohydrolase/phosphomutase
LTQLTDPLTGQQLVKRVWHREERFSGPYLERLPDLLVEAEYPDLFRPTGHYRGTAAVHHLTRDEMRRRVAGCHRSEGIFLATGPGIRAGLALPPIEITDVAPTILHLLGEPVPEWMDGRVLTEMLQPELLAARSVGQGVSEAASPHIEGLDYDADEEKALRDRLAGLGYL